MKHRKKRCWKGYKPVKGKRPYSKGSCRKIRKNAKKLTADERWHLLKQSRDGYVKRAMIPLRTAKAMVRAGLPVRRSELRGNQTPLERLRYHVSGAIARGEKQGIVGHSKGKVVKVLGQSVKAGSKRYYMLMEQKRNFDDLGRSELRGNPEKLKPRMIGDMELRLIKLLAKKRGWTKYSAKRQSYNPYDIVIDGEGPGTRQFAGDLKLIAIRELLNWTLPEIAKMSDYPDMVREGDWSGIRDSSDQAIDKIFEIFVLRRYG